jgi:hypothetical protein
MAFLLFFFLAHMTEIPTLPTKSSFLQAKPPKIALTVEDSPSEYQRRKSSGSSVNSQTFTVEPYIYEFQELERNSDNSLVLR